MRIPIATTSGQELRARFLGGMSSARRSPREQGMQAIGRNDRPRPSRASDRPDGRGRSRFSAVCPKRPQRVASLAAGSM